MNQTVRAVVFAKLPEKGRVKTRLGETVGNDSAASLYGAWVPPFLESLCELSPELSVEVCLEGPPANGSASKDDHLQEARKWLDFPVEWGLQEGDDLSARLRNAFDRQFDDGWHSAFAISTDSPHLSHADILENVRLLETHEVVLGPTEDGGYYLVGLNQKPGDLFDTVRWSTRDTLEDTRSAAEERGRSVALGPRSYDIDTRADLERFLRENRGERWKTVHQRSNGI